MPCLNEAETLEVCIRKAHLGAQRAQITSYEILIADNGSTDGSQAIAERMGARVVDVPMRGYGAALWAGILAANGRYTIMGDSDDSYDFSEIVPFIQELRQGKAIVMGSRLRGEIKPNAMPFLHRWLGNPVLTFIGRVLFGSPFSDFHCGLRAFDTLAMRNLNLKTHGMEFASEMVIRATLEHLSWAEVPVTLHPDGRSRPPHLRTWRDGWRHLRFMLLYSPRWLFFYPSLCFLALGAIILLGLGFRPLGIFGITLDVHTLLVGATAWILGIQLLFSALFARMYTLRIGILPANERLEQGIQSFSLGWGLVSGLLITLVGMGFYAVAVSIWREAGFGNLDYQQTLRLTIPGTTLIITGMQVFFNSFMISVLSIR
ncbi:MAG: glycosyltransferase family 2 protein [Phototrophicaceae bacterium]